MVAVQTHRRAELTAEILSTFGFTPGATLSGVAYGGTFVHANGEVVETLDPTTGRPLAQIRTPDPSNYDAAARAAHSAQCTLNYGASLPLAQGVRFDLDGSV